MPIEKKDLDAIGQACKEIITEELDPIKERIEALENGTAGKSGDVEALETQVTELKTALDQTLGASKSLDDEGEPVVAGKAQPRRDSWGRRVR